MLSLTAIQRPLETGQYETTSYYQAYIVKLYISMWTGLTGDKSVRASAEQMGWQEAQNSFLWAEK